MMDEKFKHYIWYLVASFKRKIKDVQKIKCHFIEQEDDSYKMGYLMALYNIINEMELFASDFGIEKKEIGLEYNIIEDLENFLINLTYISSKPYQKRINFKGEKNYEGELDQLNDFLVDQCEWMLVFAKFKENCEPLLNKFYLFLESFYQNYDGLYPRQRKQFWKEIVVLAKDILKAFDFKPNLKLNNELTVELNKEEYDYLSQASFIPQKFKKWFFSKNQNSKNHQINIHSSWADEIRDLCDFQLQVAGYDENHKPNAEGKILDELIDKFFNSDDV